MRHDLQHWTAAIAVASVVGGAWASPPDPGDVVAGASPQGKISRNVYRIPYANGMIGDLGGNDFVNHGGSLDTRASTRVCTNDIRVTCTSNADCGPRGALCDFVLVAPADGIVCTVIQHLDDCGCSGPSYGRFGNLIVILHANGEQSAFLHIKQWSAAVFGIQSGTQVTAGQPIAIEGDVGNTCNGSNAVTTCDTDGPPRAGTCLEQVPPGLNNCYRHIHWNIKRHGTFESVQPYTCRIPGNIYQPNTFFTADNCLTYLCNPNLNLALSNQVYTGTGNSQVFQGPTEISATTVSIENQANLVLHACYKVRLLPGFHADAGGYFRAEIGTADSTAPSSRPAPTSCPCNDVGWPMCVQQSDISEPDGVADLCNPPGPFMAQCRGCGFSGATLCCPCVGNGTCVSDGICP